MIYAIIALVALAAASAWLGWRCYSLRKALARSQAKHQELQKDRAIRQNLQHVLNRREAEIRRLRARLASYEEERQEMETRASDLSVTLFRESGRRILAEKEDGARRMKLEQLEQQLEAAKARLREKEAQLQRQREEHSQALDEQARRAGELEDKLREEIKAQEEEINRLRTLNARRLARRTVVNNGGLDQVTLDDILKRQD